MDSLYVGFTKFLEEYGPQIVSIFPRDKIVEMGRQAFVERKDFYIQIRDRLITVPLMSLDEYFDPKPVAAEEPKPEKAQKALKI